MGLVSNFAVIGAIVCTAVYAVARLLALLIVLRGTRPGRRAELIRAVAELFRRGSPAWDRSATRDDHTR